MYSYDSLIYNWICIYITYIFFFKFFFLIGYYKILSRVPCAIQCTLVVYFIHQSVQFSSVALSCPALWDPMNRSTPGLPVHHQLLEFTQTHVHRVSDAIQPSHPLLSPSPPAPNPSKIRVFSNESTLLMRWPKYWSFSLSILPSKEIPGLISFRMDWLDLLAV